MSTLPWRHVHLVGIGGVGMTGLALILQDLGVSVSGSDAAESRNTALLAGRGITIYHVHRAENVGRADFLVYSSAVGPENPERQQAQKRGVESCRRGEFLAQLAGHFPAVVSIAGSHGKTTVTAMLSHILIEAGRRPGYLVGGLVDGRELPAAAGAGKVLITEVDESDGTQAFMHSTHGIVTNVEDDHCWSVGGVEKLYQCFRDFAANCGFLLAVDTPVTRELFGAHPQVQWLAPTAVRQDLDLFVPGYHNRLNATLAVIMAVRLGVPEAEALAGIAGFTGVDRRLSLRYRGPEVTVIEDYAHHPTEVRESLRALREFFPGRPLRLVFQPHRNERVARYADDFCRELAAADDVTVTAPFGAWVDDADIAEPTRLAAGIEGTPARYSDLPWPELAEEMAKATCRRDVVVVMGAGSITRMVPPLIQRLQERKL